MLVAIGPPAADKPVLMIDEVFEVDELDDDELGEFWCRVEQ